jgi:hypothetical protein
LLIPRLDFLIITNEDSSRILGTPETQNTCFIEDQFSFKTAAKLNGVFARFIFFNRYSQLAFNAVVGIIKFDSDWNLYVRQFIHVNEVQRDLPLQWQASDIENDKEDKPRKIWIGYYTFSLELLPNNIRLDWILEGGRRDIKDQDVDFLLTLEKRRYKIHNRHARLTHNLDSGTFILLVNKGKEVIVNGNIVKGR